MKFCDVCENIYYLKISDEDKSLLYYCRKCGDTKKQEKSDFIQRIEL